MSWICFTLAEFRLLCLCTSRLNLLATRICSHSFAPSVRKSARTLSPIHKSGNMECHIGCNISCPSSRGGYVKFRTLHAKSRHPEADCELRLEELSLEQAQLAKRKSGTPLQASNQALVSGSPKINLSFLVT